MCKHEKIQGLKRMILFIEIFANIKRFSFRPSSGRVTYQSFILIT